MRYRSWFADPLLAAEFMRRFSGPIAANSSQPRMFVTSAGLW
jgi:hypothetical protein